MKKIINKVVNLLGPNSSTKEGLTHEEYLGKGNPNFFNLRSSVLTPKLGVHFNLNFKKKIVK